MPAHSFDLFRRLHRVNTLVGLNVAGAVLPRMARQGL